MTSTSWIANKGKIEVFASRTGKKTIQDPQGNNAYLRALEEIRGVILKQKSTLPSIEEVVKGWRRAWIRKIKAI
jgi:hypothetical protein